MLRQYMATDLSAEWGDEGRELRRYGQMRVQEQILLFTRSGRPLPLQASVSHLRIQPSNETTSQLLAPPP